MSTLQEARQVWSNVSDEEFDSLLWNCTAYPCDTPEREAEELIKLHKQHDGNAKAAIDESMAEFDAAWDEHKARVAKEGHYE